MVRIQDLNSQPGQPLQLCLLLKASRVGGVGVAQGSFLLEPWSPYLHHLSLLSRTPGC